MTDLTGVYDDVAEKEISNTQRYRMIGNGVGMPQMRWIAQRLAAVINQETNVWA